MSQSVRYETKTCSQTIAGRGDIDKDHAASAVSLREMRERLQLQLSMLQVEDRELGAHLDKKIADEHAKAKARPALLRSWAYFQAPSQTRMSHSAC